MGLRSVSRQIYSLLGKAHKIKLTADSTQIWSGVVGAIHLPCLALGLSSLEASWAGNRTDSLVWGGSFGW